MDTASRRQGGQRDRFTLAVHTANLDLLEPKLPSIEGADIHFVKGDVRPVHAEIAQAAAERNIWIVGGGDLAGQFYDCGLQDEIVVQITSVTLGGGAPLLPRRVNPPLRLLSAKTSGQNFVELHYQVPASSMEKRT